jgi:hypothetical protein
MRTHSKHPQQGQALPLGLVLLLAVAGVMFYMFNTGQLVQEKISLTNTADAVAYSAGVYEARVLNFDAYSNRAMIANEIAIGQAVGLASWAKYAGTASGNISKYAYLIPYWGPAIANALEQIKKAMDVILTPLAASVVAHDTAIQAIKASQLAVHGPANSIAVVNRKSVIDEVARKNDPDIHVDLIPLSDDFATFTSRYISRDQRMRMGQVVENERMVDNFFKRRNWDFGTFGCPIGIGLRKRGSTELINLIDGWKSMDTLSVHTYRIRRLSCRRRETPLGYGTAFSKDNLPDSAVSYARSRRDNRRASATADSGAGRAKGFAPNTVGMGAIPEFYELSDSILQSSDPKTQLAIRVTKSKNHQRFSGGAGIVKPTGALSAYESAHQANQSAAIARVEVYFERPTRNATAPTKTEIGSLFNPYWQARLVPSAPSDRVKAMLLQGFGS